MLDKIRKLLAKAEDPSITPEEAEAYNRKAAELMTKYGIENAKLEATEKRVGVVDKIITLEKPYAIDKITLLHRVAVPLGCKVVKLRGDQAHLIGFQSDIENVETVFTSLLIQMNFGLSAALLGKPPFEDPRTFKKSWLMGFSAAVYNRLNAANRKAKQEDTTPGTDLVLRDRSVVVADRVSQIYPQLRSVGRSSGGSGYGSGYRSGSSASLGNRGIGQ